MKQNRKIGSLLCGARSSISILLRAIDFMTYFFLQRRQWTMSYVSYMYIHKLYVCVRPAHIPMGIRQRVFLLSVLLFCIHSSFRVPCPVGRQSLILRKDLSNCFTTGYPLLSCGTSHNKKDVSAVAAAGVNSVVFLVF